MSDPNLWSVTAARLTGNEPVELDLAIWGKQKPASYGGELEPRSGTFSRLPSQECWPLKDPGTLHLGIRISAPVKDPLSLASALVAVSAERDLTPVLFSHLERCGLEQFGFRIEKVTGSTAQERARCEDEFMRYYQLAIIVDAQDFTTIR